MPEGEHIPVWARPDGWTWSAVTVNEMRSFHSARKPDGGMRRIASTGPSLVEETVVERPSALELAAAELYAVLHDVKVS